MRGKKRWPRLCLLVLLLFCAALRFADLTAIRELVFDELYFAKFGQDFLTFAECPEYSRVGGGYTEDRGCYDVHPPLGKLLIAVGESLFPLSDFRDYEAEKKHHLEKKAKGRGGEDWRYEFTAGNVWGWRLIPAMFGVILIFLLYVLGSLLWRSEWWGLTAAGLGAIDNYFLVQSRFALMDIFLLVFQLAAAVFFWLGWRAKSPWGRYGAYFSAAVFCGLAVGVKFTGLAVLAVGATVLVLEAYSRFEPFWFQEKRKWRMVLKTGGRGLLSFVGILAVTALVFWGVVRAPEFVFGHPFPWETDLKGKFSYHLGLKDSHPYASSWSLWPLSYKPVFYYYRSLSVFNPVTGGDEPRIVAVNAHGNLLLWWFGVGAILFWLFALARRFITRLRLGARRVSTDDEAAVTVFVLSGFFASWLPWMLIDRIAFLYHFLPSVPFLILAVVGVLRRLWHCSLTGKKTVWVLLGAFLLSFLFYLPISLGWPLSPEWYRRLMFP